MRIAVTPDGVDAYSHYSGGSWPVTPQGRRGTWGTSPEASQATPGSLACWRPGLLDPSVWRTAARKVLLTASNTGAAQRYLQNGAQHGWIFGRLDAPDSSCQCMRCKIVWLIDCRLINPVHPNRMGGIEPPLARSPKCLPGSPRPSLSAAVRRSGGLEDYSEKGVKSNPKHSIFGGLPETPIMPCNAAGFAVALRRP